MVRSADRRRLSQLAASRAPTPADVPDSWRSGLPPHRLQHLPPVGGAARPGENSRLIKRSGVAEVAAGPPQRQIEIGGAVANVGGAIGELRALALEADRARRGAFDLHPAPLAGLAAEVVLALALDVDNGVHERAWRSRGRHGDQARERHDRREGSACAHLGSAREGAPMLYCGSDIGCVRLFRRIETAKINTTTSHPDLGNPLRAVFSPRDTLEARGVLSRQSLVGLILRAICLP